MSRDTVDSSICNTAPRRSGGGKARPEQVRDPEPLGLLYDHDMNGI
jgi:hypothetical protein